MHMLHEFREKLDVLRFVLYFNIGSRQRNKLHKKISFIAS